jgi:hypothetical protein
MKKMNNTQMQAVGGGYRLFRPVMLCKITSILGIRAINLSIVVNFTNFYTSYCL